MSQWNFAVNFFVALFALIDPIGNVPLFAAATNGVKSRDARWISVYISLFVFGFLTFFYFSGLSLLEFFGISLPAFRIAGGVILFLLGLEMARDDFTATFAGAADDMNSKSGWYMDLSTQTGERIINRTQFIGGLALVTTMIPKVSDPCNTVPSGAVMLVNPFTGGNFASDIGLGTTSVKINNVTTSVPFNGMVYTVGPAAGVTGSYDQNGKINLQFNNLSGAPVQLGPISAPGAAAGRVSWRELSN